MGIDELIFIAEHNPADERFYERALEKAGFKNYRFVQDGTSVIKYLRGDGEYADRAKHPFPGMLVLDYTLPGATAAELLQWMHKNPKQRVTPTLVFSSNIKPDIVEEVYALGAHSFFRKPMEVHELGDILIDVVRYWRKAERPASRPSNPHPA
jgi:two-component system response regulator